MKTLQLLSVCVYFSSLFWQKLVEQLQSIFAIVTGVSLVEASSMLAESFQSYSGHTFCSHWRFFIQLILFVINHNYPDRGWDAPVKNYQRKQKKNLSLSLSLSLRGYRACSFFLVCFIDKKNQDLTVKERRAAQPDLRRSQQARMKKESHRWQHLSHIQTRLFSSLLRVTSSSFFFFWGFLAL